MDIAIVGPGAVGGLFAARLCEAGASVVLIDKDEKRAREIDQRGLVLEEDGERAVPVSATADPASVGPRDLVVICVKAYDTASAARTAVPLVGDSTVVLSLQNGLGNLEVLAEAFGPERVLGGTTSSGATRTGPGRVKPAGKGETVIGGYSESAAARAGGVVEVFRSAGFATERTSDLTGLLWSKLVINAGINPLTALLEVPNGALLEDEGTLSMMRALVEETVEVAKAHGVRLLHEDAVAKVEQVARATGKNRSSMLQDVLAEKRTEIDAICGEVVRHGDAAGIPVPFNRVALQMVLAKTALAKKRVQRS